MNRLADEQSPYLLQHAENPVDWYPWGNEAFERARELDRPVFLSIGYSTCHWCHVMERESFEDDDVAALMNEAFISIKVDREERPDVDGVYMTACQMMTGQGGWPLTVIMTPDKKPFHVATYIPKASRFGRLGMTDLIPRLQAAWNDRREEVLKTAEQVAESVRSTAVRRPTDDPSGPALESAYEALRARFDEEHGGFGTAPKFPSVQNLLFLLRYWRHTGDVGALEIVERTLDHMRRGGIYDHVGFGFHRYSTDRQWLLPHFEKMIYDQALLSMAYVEAYQATGRMLFRRTAEEIFAYAVRDMQDDRGGFYSAEDADSEGREGRFYVWTTDEVYDLLTDDEYDFFVDAFQLHDAGNFEEETTRRRTGENVPHLVVSAEDIDGDRLERVRTKLFEARERRVRPGRDDKVLADWNGLMVAALSKAAAAFGDERYAREARRAADFVLDEMVGDGGRLLHRFRRGEAAVVGMLDDYAYLIWGLIELYQAVFEPRYLRAARDLMRMQLDLFWDDADGGFFFTADDAEELLARQKDLHDGALPSANAVSALNLLRLARLTGETDLERRAADVLRAASAGIDRMPAGFTGMLAALSFALGATAEIVIAADTNGSDADALISTVRDGFRPNQVVLLRTSDTDLDDLAPYTAQQTSRAGRAVAYVCRDFQCQAPVDDPAALRAALDAP